MNFWLFLALAAGLPQDPGLPSVRSDDGRRAVFVQTFGGHADLPQIGGHLYLAQGPRFPRQLTYDIWLVSYDCTSRQRTNNARITYSSWRDPQNVVTNPPRIDGADNPAVADQLALVCDRDMQGRQAYQNLEEFLKNRPVP